jgi:RimJ/RimL family protein N-acetyltransferase
MSSSKVSAGHVVGLVVPIVGQAQENGLNECEMATLKPIPKISKNGLRYTIRNPKPEDAEGVLSLAKTVADEKEFQVTEADEFIMTAEQEGEWLNKLNSSESDLALVVELDGKVIGFLDFHCNNRRRRLAHTGSFGMSILREYRDQKIGTALIETLLTWATKSEQIEKVSLVVLATNERAIQVYKNLGFIEEGRRIKEVKVGPGNYVDDVLMYKLVK